MNEDYLIQEFHEAGIWLPEELEQREVEQEVAKRRAEFLTMQARALQNRMPR